MPPQLELCRMPGGCKVYDRPGIVSANAFSTIDFRVARDSGRILSSRQGHRIYEATLASNARDRCNCGCRFSRFRAVLALRCYPRRESCLASEFASSHRSKIAIEPIEALFNYWLEWREVPRFERHMAFLGAGHSQKAKQWNLRRVDRIYEIVSAV